MSEQIGIRLLNIRAHEGSAARAWEELTYQLRPEPGSGHVQTRKTRAPDGGVEWYEIYDDGHEEGFQAKFNPDLAAALGSMRTSIKSVCAKRPNMTRLTFTVPYDFTDSGTSKTKNDQDRWDDAVADWKAEIPGAANIEFATIRAGDIIDKLTREEHAGRRAYWFGALELTDDWFRTRWTEAEKTVGKRYTPDADTSSGINDLIDAVTLASTYRAKVGHQLDALIAACGANERMWGSALLAASAHVEQLIELRESGFGADHGTGADYARIAGADPDLAAIHDTAGRVRDAADERLRLIERGDSDRAHAMRVLNIARSLRAQTRARLADIADARALAVIGAQGQGKTHALMRVVDRLLDEGVPAIAIPGQRLRDLNWWPAINDILGGLHVSSDVFLQALNSLAQARRHRAVLVIDALNESRRPGSWADELPALLAQLARYEHIALIVSYRSDYRQLIGAPDYLQHESHPGIAGNEERALEAYCELFNISPPTQSVLDPAFSNPLFLRMYCEVLAADPGTSTHPTRSTLFSRFAQVKMAKVNRDLSLPPQSKVPSNALDAVADALLANDSRPVDKDAVEEAVDALLPGRSWPDTLFQRLVSEGLLETYPGADGAEVVGFPFQVYSEHLVALRLLKQVDDQAAQLAETTSVDTAQTRARALAEHIGAAPWSWRAMAVLLPETGGVELIDILGNAIEDQLLTQATTDSLTDRNAAAFGNRAMELLAAGLASGRAEAVETILTLAPRVRHPGNSSWLHEQLAAQTMPDRDATWSIATYRALDDSPALARLLRWAQAAPQRAHDSEIHQVALTLTWLLGSPNRFLRDTVSKTLAALLATRLTVAAGLLELTVEIDDPYIVERTWTCCYGALIVGAPADSTGAGALAEAAHRRGQAGLPVNTLARDSAYGIAAYAHDAGLLTDEQLAALAPPYSSDAPNPAPTAQQLNAEHGRITDGDEPGGPWRAQSILSSCLTWMGDFRKYVVGLDVKYVSRHRLTGPAPMLEQYRDRQLGTADVDEAGRWIAHRAIELGWTSERFEQFESASDYHRGRDAHKAERFGKKYQWIAHHEYMARLTDNFHLARESWSPDPNPYQGPWPWGERDFDPTLPPSIDTGELRRTTIVDSTDHAWAALASPDMDETIPADDWATNTTALPEPAAMFAPCEPGGRQWVALYRYGSWDRTNAAIRGISNSSRNTFYLQFAWLTVAGQGQALYERLTDIGLGGRWMPDTTRTRGRYLGEGPWAPIAATVGNDPEDTPEKLKVASLNATPAVENFLYSGDSLDCSLDESLDFTVPSDLLLGTTPWQPHTATWAKDGRTVAQAVEIPDGTSTQTVLLVNPRWLEGRLNDLGCDLVIGTLSDRFAQDPEDAEDPDAADDGDKLALTHVTYLALLRAGEQPEMSGPHLKVERTAT